MLLRPLCSLTHELKQDLARRWIRAFRLHLIEGKNTRSERGVDGEENPTSIGIHDAQAHAFGDGDNLLVDQGHVEHIHTHWTYSGW